MFEQIVKYQYVILPVAIIAISLVAGIIVNRLIFAKLHDKLSQIEGVTYQIVAKALKGMPVVWSVTFGIYLAINSVPIHTTLQHILANILLALILLSITMVAARTVAGMVTAYAQKAEAVLPSTSLLVNLAELTIYITGFLIILQSFGISVTPILTALGVGGLAVALALQDTLSNMFSGIHILLSRQIKIGDYIKLSSGEEGNIADISWRNTIIQALGNSIIIVPNTKIASSIITNFHMPAKDLAVIIPVGVSYDSDLDKVEQVTIEVAKQVMADVEGGVSDFEPVIRFQAFGDSSINFNVILRANEFIAQYVIKHEFIKRLAARYRSEGIEIPFPIRTIHMKDQE